jgi:HCOMODA/2-hydroxy-3-carboxy-muconic semialdehyde decarboxylase
MSSLDRAIRDLVVANRILAHEGVCDAYGHVSIRHPERPDRFLLSRSRSPELVEAGDIMQFHFDGSPVDDDRPPYLERFIHGAVYEARPDVMAVVHSHAEGVLPFSISTTPLRPVIHAASDCGAHIPVWDIRDHFGDTNLLVVNPDQGRDLAQALGPNNVALMRGHGFVAAAHSLVHVLRMSVALPRNARVMLDAMRLGDIKPLSDGEIALKNATMRGDSPAVMRAWEYWARRCGCAHMLADTDGEPRKTVARRRR